MQKAKHVTISSCRIDYLYFTYYLIEWCLLRCMISCNCFYVLVVRNQSLTFIELTDSHSSITILNSTSLEPASSIIAVCLSLNCFVTTVFIVLNEAEMVITIMIVKDDWCY